MLSSTFSDVFLNSVAFSEAFSIAASFCFFMYYTTPEIAVIARLAAAIIAVRGFALRAVNIVDNNPVD